MSSIESSKHPAEDVPADEPNAKKIKVNDQVDQGDVNDGVNEVEEVDKVGDVDNEVEEVDKVGDVDDEDEEVDKVGDVEDEDEEVDKVGDVDDEDEEVDKVGDIDDDDDIDDDEDDQKLEEDEDEQELEDDEDEQELEDDEETASEHKQRLVLQEVETLDKEIHRLNEEASEEILLVEQKFNRLRKPYYEKRAALLKRIPNFWLGTLVNHPSIGQMIVGEDEDCLHYLNDLEVEEFEDIKSGYRIKLYFNENPYFKNECVVKEFHTISDDEQVASTTPLEYKDTEKARILKENIERELESLKSMSKYGQLKSFFAWFLDPIDLGSDDIADFIKEQIWNNPVEFYLSQENPGLNDSDLSDEEEIDDEDQDPDGDIYEDDEDDEEDDDVREIDGN